MIGIVKADITTLRSIVSSMLHPALRRGAVFAERSSSCRRGFTKYLWNMMVVQRERLGFLLGLLLGQAYYSHRCTIWMGGTQNEQSLLKKHLNTHTGCFSNLWCSP